MLKNFVERLMSGLLYDEPGDGGGGGGTGDGGTSVADNNGATKPGDGQGDTTKKAATGSPASGVKLEDDPRYRGMMSDLQKERKARQQYDADLKAAKAELDQERRRVQALAGVNPKSKDEEDEALIRQRMETLYPWMKDLTSEDVKALKESQGQIAEIRSATTTQWKAHGQKMLTSLTGGLQKALGGGKLSDRQAHRIQEAYVGAARSNPDFLARHESGDPALIEEFVKEWVEDFVEPGRRSALSSETQSQRRPRVPGGKDRSIVGTNDKPIDVKDSKAVEDMLVKGFRERGGQFGRR